MGRVRTIKPGITAIYLIGRMGGPWKIGLATNPYVRMAELQTACPFQLQMYGYDYFPSREYARASEMSLHALFAADRLCGEWFDVVPYIAFVAIQNASRRCYSQVAA